MDRPAIYPVNGPEEKIVQDLIKFLKERGWHYRRTHGNLYQAGYPDLWIGHELYGHRWVEVKNAESYKFQPSQKEFFPILNACSDPVWILTAATPAEYAKLWQKSNYLFYLQKLG